MTKPLLADLPMNSIIGLIGSNSVSPGAGAMAHQRAAVRRRARLIALGYECG
jgi:hypothetical protein